MHELVIAVLQAPYGLKGELKVRSLSGENEHILALAGQSITLRQAVSGKSAPAQLARIVESARVVEPHLLIKFKGLDTPEDARKLTGCEILVAREQAAPLGSDEYYIGELIGCSLLRDGTVIGTVLSVWETGAHDMLEVKLTDSSAEAGFRVVQVPFRSPFIGQVDQTARTIELLAAWVLE